MLTQPGLQGPASVGVTCPLCRRPAKTSKIEVVRAARSGPALADASERAYATRAARMRAADRLLEELALRDFPAANVPPATPPLPTHAPSTGAPADLFSLRYNTYQTFANLYHPPALYNGNILRLALRTGLRHGMADLR